MAFVTGTMLLVLCLEMVLKYGFNDGQPVLGTWVAILHGWIYVVYAAAVLNLWSTMRWGFGRIVALIAGGVVPVLSFVMERRAQGWFTAEPAGAARPGRRPRSLTAAVRRRSHTPSLRRARQRHPDGAR